MYILSNKSHTMYTGVATDLRRRFHEHMTGVYANAFTRRYHFDRLVYFEPATDLASAARREKQIKAWRREKRVHLIQSMNPNWLDLSPRLDPLRLFE